MKEKKSSCSLHAKTIREYVKGKQEKFLTTHHERDEETGLDYRGARFYDADIGRFLSLDPAAADYPQWSDYNYVLGNPVIYIDPDGRNAVVSINEEKDENGKVISRSISITAKVYVSGKYATQEITDAAQASFNSIFKDGVYTDKEGNEWKIELDVTFEFFEAEGHSDFFSKLNKAEGKSWKKGDNVILVEAGIPRSHVRGGAFEIGKGFIAGGVSHINKDDNAWVFAHETGHLIGLSDRYTDDGKKGSVPHKGFETDAMGRKNATGMSQVHYNNWGKYLLQESKTSGKKNFILEHRVDTDRTNQSLISN